MRIFSLLFALLCCAFLPSNEPRFSKELKANKRLIVIMFDGFGMSYYRNAPMPNLHAMAEKGFFKQVEALMPTVTNANNAAICCAALPEKTGITGNSFLAASGEEEYMEDKSLVKTKTMFEKLAEHNIKSALIASKKKSIGLLSAGTSIALSPETADSSWLRLLGTPPSIYSSNVNYWSFDAALYLLKNRKDIRCLYIHTTDYPMHMWAPTDSNSLKHLMTIDSYLGKIRQVAPDAMIMLTADHDVNHKSRCVDIEKALAQKSMKVKIAISAERDKYLKQHRGFGGTSFVYLNSLSDAGAIKKALLEIKGVKSVLTKTEAAKLYHLLSERIGDLIVFADENTVFGNLESNWEENLPENYRTHGSEYEKPVPMLIYNAMNLPAASYFKYNYQLTAWYIP